MFHPSPSSDLDSTDARLGARPAETVKASAHLVRGGVTFNLLSGRFLISDRPFLLSSIRLPSPVRPPDRIDFGEIKYLMRLMRVRDFISFNVFHFFFSLTWNNPCSSRYFPRFALYLRKEPRKRNISFGNELTRLGIYFFRRYNVKFMRLILEFPSGT